MQLKNVRLIGPGWKSQTKSNRHRSRMDQSSPRFTRPSHRTHSYATNRLLTARRFRQTRGPSIVRSIRKETYEETVQQKPSRLAEEETYEALRLGFDQDAWTFRTNHGRGHHAGRRAEKIRYRRHRHGNQ